MPSARTSRSALPFRKVISGRQTVEKARWGATTARATWSGREMAQFFGTSSPMTICSTVASTMPTATATPVAAEDGTPTARATGESRTESAGSASMPTTSEVTVMPSCAPESWKESCRSARPTFAAFRSPAAAARWTAPRSTVTKANSAATKRPLARMSSTAADSSSQAVITVPPAFRCGEARRRGYYRTDRPSRGGVTPQVAGGAQGFALALPA